MVVFITRVQALDWQEDFSTGSVDWYLSGYFHTSGNDPSQSIDSGLSVVNGKLTARK